MKRAPVPMLALLLVVFGMVSCASSGRHVSRESVGPRQTGSPDGEACFIGASDPWLDDNHTWAEAGRDAIRNLFVAFRPMAVRNGSISYSDNVGNHGADAVLIEELKATLSGARVVGWWLDNRGVGPRHMCGNRCKRATVWAVACLEGHEAEASSVLPEAFRGPIPAWLKSQKPFRDKYCSVGISGPTLKPEDAIANSAEDARHRVGLMICGVGDHAFVDYLAGGGTWSFPDTTPSPEAEAYVRGLAGTEGESLEYWIDDQGKGPLGTRGVAYARLCVPRVAVPCDEH